MKKTMIMLCLALVSGGAFAQTTPEFKNSKLGTAYETYIQLKDELVASNFDNAKKMVNSLTKSLSDVPNSEKVLSQATKLALASTIKDQRLVFTDLSNEMITLVKGQVSKGQIFVAYCPMANGNTGASWLANEKDINNPYFGDMMLKCGSVKETID